MQISQVSAAAFSYTKMYVGQEKEESPCHHKEEEEGHKKALFLFPLLYVSAEGGNGGGRKSESTWAGGRGGLVVRDWTKSSLICSNFQEKRAKSVRCR